MIKGLLTTDIDDTILSIFERIEEDNPIDFADIDDGIPKNRYVYDILFILDIDQDFNEFLANSYFKPFPFTVDLHEDIREEFYSTISNGDTIRGLLYNAYHNIHWSKIELLAFKD